MKIFKYITLSIIVIIGLIVILFFVVASKLESITSKKIDINKNKEIHSVWVKQRIWGGIDSRSDIYFSKRKKWRNKYNPNKEYFFPYHENLFLKTSDDTLFLYVREVSIEPKKFEIPFVIIQIKLENPDYMHMWSNYKNMGIEKIFD